MRTRISRGIYQFMESHVGDTHSTNYLVSVCTMVLQDTNFIELYRKGTLDSFGHFLSISLYPKGILR